MAQACEYVNDKYAAEATMEPIDWLSLCERMMRRSSLHEDVHYDLFSLHERNDKAEISVICVSHCRWSTDELCGHEEENKNYISQ